MDIISILNYFGFTPANVTPLVVVGVVGLITVFKHTKPIRESLQEIRERFARLEGSLSGTFQTQSPISLLPKGEEILIKSGLKKYIDTHAQELLGQCKSSNPMSNPYDVQEASFKFFDKLKFADEIEDELKTTAFNFGVDITVVRRIGGIYFRDLCLKEHGFSPEDLDKPQG